MTFQKGHPIFSTKGQFKKGNSGYWLGKKRPDLWNGKRKDLKGKRLSPKTEFKRGIHYSPQTEFKIGTRINVGRIHSEEFKKRNSLVHKGLPSWCKGKKLSEEHRAKLKEARKYRIVSHKDTSIEVKIQNYLKQLGIEFFTHQYIKEIEHGYQCDILIPSINLVIECDGDYWHKYPIGRDIDHVRTSELLENGFKVLRLWECEINQMSLEAFKNKISQFGAEI